MALSREDLWVRSRDSPWWVLLTRFRTVYRTRDFPLVSRMQAELWAKALWCFLNCSRSVLERGCASACAGARAPPVRAHPGKVCVSLCVCEGSCCAVVGKGESEATLNTKRYGTCVAHFVRAFTSALNSAGQARPLPAFFHATAWLVFGEECAGELNCG